MPIIPPPPKSDSDRFDDWIIRLHKGVTQRVPWTPTLSYATPGDAAFTYLARAGDLLYAGGLYCAQFNIITSAFTHTTSAGDLQLTGLPISATSDANYTAVGTLQWNGITKANYTQWMCYLTAGVATIKFLGQGSGVSNVTLGSADMPTGGTIILCGTLWFR